MAGTVHDNLRKHVKPVITIRQKTKVMFTYGGVLPRVLSYFMIFLW